MLWIRVWKIIWKYLFKSAFKGEKYKKIRWEMTSGKFYETEGFYAKKIGKYVGADLWMYF